MNRPALSLEEKVGIWEDKREIRNLMGRFTNTIFFKEEETIFEKFWSQERDDVCYGTNDGWYAGPEAVKGYFDSIAARVSKADEIIKARFPEAASVLKPEDRGLGTVDVKGTSTELVEVAADGKTAKCLCHARGQDTLAEEFGPRYFYTFGAYAVDLIREKGAWKIWHMDYQEDIRHPAGQKWWEPQKDLEGFPEFAAMAEVPIAKPNHPAKRREHYSLTRQFKAFGPVPEPYETFAETFSYGMEGGK